MTLWWRFVTKIVFDCCFLVVAIGILAFVVDVAIAEFDVVIPAVVAAVIFHSVAVLVLFVVAAVASDFETGDVHFAVAWYFLKTIASYFVDHDDVVESAVSRLHLTNSVDLAVFL